MHPNRGAKLGKIQGGLQILQGGGGLQIFTR